MENLDPPTPSRDLILEQVNIAHRIRESQKLPVHGKPGSTHNNKGSHPRTGK